MSPKSTKKVNPEAAELAAEAEKLKQAGFGSSDKPFDLKEDMAAQAMAGLAPPSVVEKPEEPSDVAPAQAESTSENTLSDDPQERLEQVAAELKNMRSDAPDAGVLQKWKNVHGNIFVVPVEEFVFIFRYLKRIEWNELNLKEDFTNMTEAQQAESIFNRCVLWPRFAPDQFMALPAGAVDMIVEQIKLQSLFLNPYAVASQTIKL